MAAPFVKSVTQVFRKNIAILSSWSPLNSVNLRSVPCRCNAHRASVSRINRSVYKRMYPVILVRPDGSTVQIRYHEPRKIIKMPLDLNTLSEEKKLERLARRKPKQTFVVEEEIEDNYDPSQYSKYIR